MSTTVQITAIIALNHFAVAVVSHTKVKSLSHLDILSRLPVASYSHCEQGSHITKCDCHIHAYVNTELQSHATASRVFKISKIIVFCIHFQGNAGCEERKKVSKYFNKHMTNSHAT